jgi:hypothetical protein
VTFQNLQTVLYLTHKPQFLNANVAQNKLKLPSVATKMTCLSVEWMFFIKMNEINEGLKVRRPDKEQPSLLLDQTVFDLFFCDKCDCERVGNALSDPDEKSSIHIDPG